tara:strand:- start:269 stop:526 length:258 start_codon:yes stop_codon:yes gene_type:complete
MAKQLLEIKRFNVGTILSPDAKDIPPEAASYSLNIDSVTEDGKLKGIPNDSITATFPGGISDIVFLQNGSDYIMVVNNNGLWRQQ